MKRCPRCGITKEDDEFYRDRRRPDKLSGHCKECARCYQRKDKTNPNAFAGYSPEELLVRWRAGLYEHVLEVYNASQLQPIFGVKWSDAEEIRETPSLMSDVMREKMDRHLEGRL